MAERERGRATTPGSGEFRPRVRVMTRNEVTRALRRMGHEVLERNHGAEQLIIIGLQTGGVGLARRLAANIFEIEGTEVPIGKLDATMHRDDFGLRPVMPEAVTEISEDLTGRVVVLVDDVLFTGRTVRAALDAVHSYGRPASIQLAVMVDRGHRELPIRPDFVGKNLPTRSDELVDVHEEGVDLGHMA